MSKEKPIRLAEIPTSAPDEVSKKSLEEATDELVQRLGELHYLLTAEGKHAVLIIFQGMDASGKDGAVRRVFANCTVAGLNLVSFKKPTPLEMDHDFLWRIHQAVPAKGTMTIFNRSHYEDILIQRVHGWIDMERVERRMEAINHFEALLTFDNNTHIFKFFLHTSHDEQEKQLRERLEDPTKHWKHQDGDWEERKHWDEYMEAYEYALNNSAIPWHICPVDDRWYRNYFIAKTLVEGLEKLNMKFPPLPEKNS